jgi:hypothetical protein
MQTSSKQVYRPNNKTFYKREIKLRNAKYDSTKLLVAAAMLHLYCNQQATYKVHHIVGLSSASRSIRY